MKIEKIGHYWPTGYMFLDAMLGENVRDLDGNLIDLVRGFETTGKQYGIAGVQGTGKSTLAGDIMSFPVQIDMADILHKCIIFDTDNAAWTLHRLVKITNLPMEVIKEKFRIVQTQDITEIVKILKEESAEYCKQKYRPVKYYDPYMDCEREAMPMVSIVFDTITSISSVEYIEKDALAKQQSMTTFLDVSNLSNNINTFFNGNNFVTWLAHLKENVPKIGQTVAEKEFKSAPAKWKSHIPVRIRQKLTNFLWLTKTQDMENQESKTHPIQVYGLQDLETKSIFLTNGLSVKSRTGTEARTVAKLMFINGKFDRVMSLLASCLEIGALEEVGGLHPTAATPSIFKDQPGCEAEYKAQGRRSKTTLRIKGFDRPTNIIEARLLLNYMGDNEEILEIAQDLRIAIQERVDEILFYELETNNVTRDELETNQKKIRSLLGFIKATRKEKRTISSTELENGKPEKKDDYLE